MAKTILSLFVILTVVWLADPASATWSIAAVDPDTGEVGVAVASCVPASQLSDPTPPLSIVAIAPGVGVGISQAAVNFDVPPHMEVMLDAGNTSQEIVAEVSSMAFDDDAQSRQHGVVTLDGEAAGFTGNETLSYAGDSQGFSVSVQGNILVGEAVIDDALAAFLTLPDLPLADRLVAALEAGSAAGGDNRCEQTALFAHLVVAGPNDSPDAPAIVLTYGSSGDGDNPVETLVDRFASGARNEADIPDLSGGLGTLGTVAFGVAAVAIAAGAFFWRRRAKPARDV